MNRFIVGIVLCGVVAGSAAGPVHAAEPLKTYANCTALAKVYPAGVAKSRAAAVRAVAAGMRRPKVSSSIYADNRGKDRDRDGVACEVPAPAPVAPAVIVIPTGNLLWDSLVKAQADTGSINQAQATAITAIFLSVRRLSAQICPSMRDATFEAQFLDTLVTVDNLAKQGLVPEMATWMRQQGGFAIGIACAEAGIT